MQVKIRCVDVFPIKIPRSESEIYLGPERGRAKSESSYYYREGYRCVYSSNMETCFVKLTTDTGAVGWGEALSPVAPEVVAKIITSLLSPLLIGSNPLDTNVLWTKMYDSMRDRGHTSGFMMDAIAACDTALWDLKGKLFGEPVYKLLGGAYRQQIPAYVSGLPKPTLAERVELAKSWKSKGFSAIKLALGWGRQEDAHNLSAVRAAVGPDVNLFIDAHWNYTVAEALDLGRELEKIGVTLYEAPLPPEDIAGHAELRRALTVPVAVGEAERTRYHFRDYFLHRAVDVVQPDVGRVGISETMRIGAMAEAFNVRVAPHLSVGLGICIAASIHVAAALPNLFMLEYQPPVLALANQLLEEPLSCEAGAYSLPAAPGLGVAIRENELLPFCVK